MNKRDAKRVACAITRELIDAALQSGIDGCEPEVEAALDVIGDEMFRRAGKQARKPDLPGQLTMFAEDA